MKFWNFTLFLFCIVLISFYQAIYLFIFSCSSFYLFIFFPFISFYLSIYPCIHFYLFISPFISIEYSLFINLSLFSIKNYPTIYLLNIIFLSIDITLSGVYISHLSIFSFRYLTGLPVEGRYTVRLIVTDNHGKAFAPLKVYGEPTRSCCLDVPAKVEIYSMYIRHDQYWQTAYPKFLVASNCIKKGSKFFFHLRRLSWFWGQFSRTALVIDTFYVKYCSGPSQY